MIRCVCILLVFVVYVYLFRTLSVSVPSLTPVLLLVNPVKVLVRIIVRLVDNVVCCGVTAYYYCRMLRKLTNR